VAAGSDAAVIDTLIDDALINAAKLAAKAGKRLPKFRLGTGAMLPRYAHNPSHLPVAAATRR
jgi:hypothetical protein